MIGSNEQPTRGASATAAELRHIEHGTGRDSQRNLFIVGFCMYNALALAAGAGNPGVKGGSYFALKFAPVPGSGTGGFPFGDDDEFFGTFFNNTMIISLLCAHKAQTGAGCPHQ